MLLLLACAPGAISGARDVGFSSARSATPADALVHGDWWAEPASGKTFGTAADGVGDVNADGYDDVVVTDPSANSTYGYVYLYLGSAGGLADTPASTLSAADNYLPGTSVTTLGDANGDGYGDFAYGHPGYSKGYMTVAYGAATGVGSTTVITGATSSDYLGYQVAGGDVDGDGDGDLFAASYLATSSDYGRIVLYLGAATGIATTTTWSLSGDTAKDELGYAMSVGDLDGDGYADLAYSVPGLDDGQTDEGGLRVHYGGATGPGTTANWRWSPDATGDACCDSVDLRGDFDGDGFLDLVAGTSGHDGDVVDEGIVRVFAGSASGPATEPTWTWSPGIESCGAGAHVRALGDTDGDGYDDLAVSAPACDDGVGRVWVFRGSYAGLGDPTEVGDGTGIEAWGTAIGAAGDVDGDGDTELLVGVPSFGASGRVWLFDGQAGGPTPADLAPTVELAIPDLGTHLVNAGDTDGNGFDDLLIASGSRLYLYRVTEDGIAESPSWSAAYTADTVGDEPWAVGDFNRDGRADLALGTYTTTGTETTEGSFALYLGGATGLQTIPAEIHYGGQAYASLGRAVAAVGDVDGDGFEDLAVGADRYDDLALDEGAVWIYPGGSAGLGTPTRLTIGQDSASFGVSLAGGDLDGDGLGDVVIGADLYDDTVADEGAVFLVRGAPGGVDPTATLLLVGGTARANLGATLSALGDLDGDGLTEVGVQAGTNDDDLVVYTGLGRGETTSALTVTVRDGAIAHGGDADGDGFADLFVGDVDFDNSAPDVGRARLYPGSSGGPAPDAVDVEGDYGDGACGAAVELLDLDGDGAAERLVSCPDYDGGTLLIVAGGPLDRDGDGAVSPADCDDDDATRHPGAEEACDGIDNNCDGAVDEAPPTWFKDADGDGAGDPARPLASCLPPSGYAPDGDDCDDADAAVSPAAAEVCDGVDNNCDGAIDEAGGGPWYADTDGDGAGGRVTSAACSQPAGYTAANDDCDDADGANFPGNAEVCDDADNDCDGDVDEGVGVIWFADLDGDGSGAEVVGFGCTGPDGAVDNDDDCDDTSSSIGPDAPEVCGGGDEDCDGLVDVGAADAFVYYLDADGDGAAGATEQRACELPADAFRAATDCDDGDATIGPLATEVCDGLDDDCDGTIDEDGTTVYYRDLDADGVGGADTATGCTAPLGYVAGGGDCDDTTVAISPLAEERCDAVDNNCDGVVDEAGGTAWYADADGDGYGGGDMTIACTAPAGTLATSDDCDDTQAAVNPGAPETCDGVDDNCDGTIDEAGGTAWYVDVDGDGLGGTESVVACAAPDGSVATPGDCDDADPAVTVGGPWYTDADGDGYGVDPTTTGCEAPAGFAAVDGDCDDTSRHAHPGAPERWYDGVDEACDGGSDYDRDGDGDDAEAWGGGDCDDGDPEKASTAADEPYDGVVSDCTPEDEYDVDGDGFRAVEADGDDCDDRAASINPSAKETWYDGIDQDCDGDDDDHDRDGVAFPDDCDDDDATVQVCDPAGCGCDTTRGAGLPWLLGLLALRRRA